MQEDDLNSLELKVYVKAFKEKAVRFMSRHNPNKEERLYVRALIYSSLMTI